MSSLKILTIIPQLNKNKKQNTKLGKRVYMNPGKINAIYKFAKQQTFANYGVNTS